MSFLLNKSPKDADIVADQLEATAHVLAASILTPCPKWQVRLKLAWASEYLALDFVTI